MDTEHLIRVVCWAAAAWVVMGLALAWLIWRHAEPMPTNVIRFEELNRYGKD